MDTCCLFSFVHYCVKQSQLVPKIAPICPNMPQNLPQPNDNVSNATPLNGGK